MSAKMYKDMVNENLPISPQSIDDAGGVENHADAATTAAAFYHGRSTDNVACSLYKGWILMCDESSLAKPLYSTHAERYIYFDTIRWVPKYAVACKEDKLVYLYDHEPSSAEMSCLFRHTSHLRSSTSSTLSTATNKSAASTTTNSYRLDNAVKPTAFVSFWHNKSPKYEETVIKCETNGNGDHHNGHHSKDFDSHHEKDSLNSFPSSNSNHHHENSIASSTVSSSNSTFRFAGLFFKKDKSEKVKHSSLKRAKSGIQLERKKTGGDSTANSSSATTPTTDATPDLHVAKQQQHHHHHSKIENRQSLPSPMRPSRSHESLSSPLKPNAPSLPGSGGRDSSKKPKGSDDLSSQPQEHAYLPADFASPGSIVKLNLAGPPGSKASAKPQSPRPRLVEVHPVHNSLLNEENCFEVRCFRSCVKVTVTGHHDSVSNAIDADDVHTGAASFNYENDEAFEDEFNRHEHDDYDPSASSSSSTRHHDELKKQHSSKNSDSRRVSGPPPHRPRRKSRRDQSTNSFQQHAGVGNGGAHVLESQPAFGSLYFMCRSADEREKWLQCLSSICKPNQLNEKHQESSLQLWLLEAKGQALSSKPNKKYMCEIVLNKNVLARTCSKEKKDMLFWGEHIELNNAVNCDYVRVELYQETVETIKKKTAKRENLHSTSSGGKENGGAGSGVREPSALAALVGAGGGSKSVVRSTKQVLLGFVNIPVSSIDANQPVEKWYCLESASNLAGSSYDLTSSASNGGGGGGGGIPSGLSGLAATHINPSHSNMSLSAAGGADSPGSSFTNSTASLTTTQAFGKGAISIRIKAKYQAIDILPIHCYDRLVHYLSHGYMHLAQSLEPHLTVRLKDDLAGVLVRVAHKLRIQVRFLCDLISAEVLGLEDNSITFRGNSLATKSIEAYMKLVGENYLKQTLSDCIRSIIDTTNDLEIDPSKVSNQSNLHANREELVQVLHLVCGRVLNSCVNFPIELKFVFARLRELCKRHGKSDEMCDTLISASIFLRFICPAILSPNLFNLTQEYPQEKAARKLTLAAKTLQTIANFSKFGAKEFYMSFDKMNHFVDEHTVLMREFLRNISTLSAQDFASLDESTQYLGVELDDIDAVSDYDGLEISRRPHATASHGRRFDMESLKSQLAGVNGVGGVGGAGGELKFTAEFIDLGKQLSVLHKLLGTIFEKLDEPVRRQFDELIGILGELEQIKANPSGFVLPAADHASTGTNGTEQAAKTRLLSYENRLHFASLNKTPGAGGQENGSASSVASLTPPLQGSKSIQAIVIKSAELMTPTSSLKSDSSNEITESAKSSSNYSSQLILNINPASDKASISAARLVSSASSMQHKLEGEINVLKQRLRETEQQLKKEQTEKYLIEYKLKQQQQDNDQQMKNIINRLIKVEEELRKEQSEMHKILKAKQDLIEIQKKRIEFLSNRVISTTNATTAAVTKSAKTGGMNGSGSVNNLNGGFVNSSSSSSSQSQQTLTNNHPSAGYNQHVYQAKSKTRAGADASSVSPPANAENEDKRGSPADSSSSANSPSHASSADSAVAPVSGLLKQQQQQIAASPSSSSSSMTQFCSYLASNSSLMNNNEAPAVVGPTPAPLNGANLRKLLNNSSSSSNSTTTEHHVHRPVGKASSADSSSPSPAAIAAAVSLATSTSSHQLAPSPQTPYNHFLRTSEL